MFKRQRCSPVVHVPERRESAARPRERRARRSGSSRAGPSSESDLPPVGLLRGFTAASVRMVQHLQRRNAAMRLA
jgi:hypothetical protein